MTLALAIGLSFVTAGVALIIWVLVWGVVAMVAGARRQEARKRAEEASGVPQIMRRYPSQYFYEKEAQRMLGVGYQIHSTSEYRISKDRKGISVVYRHDTPPALQTIHHVHAQASVPTTQCAYCRSTVPITTACAHCGAPLSV